MGDPAHDPGRYGASFAEVYDRWYPGGDEASIASFMRSELDPGARILELGVGTGRIAMALAGAGFEVTGMDSSPEMLAQLAAKDPRGTVPGFLADAGDPDTWSGAALSGPFDCVLAACNLLLNLTAPGAQQACVHGVAAVLAPGGIFVTEVVEHHLPESSGEEILDASVHSELEVRIASRFDPATGLLEGRHMELLGHHDVRVRPWSIRPLPAADLRDLCRNGGLSELASHAGWGREPWAPGDPTRVTVFG